VDFKLNEEQRLLKESVARFVDNQVIPLAPEIDEDGAFPEKNFRSMAEMGLFGISIPQEYGGSGVDLLSCQLVMEELARGCASTANTFGAHSILCT
jgi:alkylation response protein AidB-like acyl-CoA dehydrogenase